MSDKEDTIFLRNFAIVLIGLVVVAILAFILARTVTSNARSSYADTHSPVTPVSTYSEDSLRMAMSSYST